MEYGSMKKLYTKRTAFLHYALSFSSIFMFLNLYQNTSKFHLLVRKKRVNLIVTGHYGKTATKWKVESGEIVKIKTSPMF